jgi:malate dehydrogenase
MQLALYDIVNAPGVAVDLSHISTPAKVEGYLPADDGLEKALTGANIVVIPAGIPRKPGVSSHAYCSNLTVAHTIS